jgi:tight adherence protein C
MTEIAIPILAFISVLAIGVSYLLTQKQKQKMMEVRLQDSRLVGMPEKEKTKKFEFLKLFAQIGNVASHGTASRTLSEQLLRAGYIGSAAPAIHTGIKVLLFLLGIVIMTVMVMPTELTGTSKVLFVIFAATTLFFLPNFIVLSRLRKRREEIRLHLPEVVDLLEICVSSGMGLDMAWHIVSEEIRQVSTILANAMSLANFEINLGANRVEAMRHMAERTGVNELSSLATILIQTERFGTSIADTLTVFANSLREERTHTAEENAEKMAVKMLFPMVLCIFPSVLVAVAGPAIITLFGPKLFGSG